MKIIRVDPNQLADQELHIFQKNVQIFEYMQVMSSQYPYKAQYLRNSVFGAYRSRNVSYQMTSHYS